MGSPLHLLDQYIMSLHYGFIGLYEVRTNLLKFFQTLIHSQSISQCSSSLNSSFIQFKTVEEIIPELVQGMKINYYIVHDKTSCFMSKPLHQSGWVDKQLCKNQGVALYDYYSSHHYCCVSTSHKYSHSSCYVPKRLQRMDKAAAIGMDTLNSEY